MSSGDNIIQLFAEKPLAIKNSDVPALRAAMEHTLAAAQLGLGVLDHASDCGRDAAVACVLQIFAGLQINLFQIMGDSELEGARVLVAAMQVYSAMEPLYD